MDPKERQRIIRLTEKINELKDYSRMLGIKDVSDYKKESEGRK